LNKSKADFIIVDGKIIDIKIKDVKGKRPLSKKELKEFKNFVNKFKDDIVQKWIDYFVYHKRDESKMTQLLEKFRELPDYRKCKQLKFNVGEIMFMSLLAILSGANGYMDMEFWIKSKKRELQKFLGHAFIAPADNTIRNVFLNIDKDALDKMFENWAHSTANTNSTSIEIYDFVGISKN